MAIKHPPDEEGPFERIEEIVKDMPEVESRAFANFLEETDEVSGQESQNLSETILEYWDHLYGDSQGYLSIFSAIRPPGEKGKVNKGRYEDFGGAYNDRYYSWPDEAEEAARYALEESEKGRNVYCCAHLLTAKERVKENAARVNCLWAEGDAAEIPEEFPHPTLTIESSPGRYHHYWRLNQGIDPNKAEELNRRLTYEIGADKSGWALTKLLRPPGTKNYDYAEVHEEVPTVREVL
jgi:hypothetical protein